MAYVRERETWASGFLPRVPAERLRTERGSHLEPNPSGRDEEKRGRGCARPRGKS